MRLTVARRFRGPSSSGNGGYTAGVLASWLGAFHEDDGGAITVTLRRPPPLDVAMPIEWTDNGARLVDGDALVAEAVLADDRAADELRAVPPVDQLTALRASQSYPGLTNHPFPECFVCGPDRVDDDGMLLAPGRLGDGRTACDWHVDEDLAFSPEFVWAALDCPGGWAAPLEGRPMVLGRMTAQVIEPPDAGENCVVMGQLLGTEGRKTWTATTLYGEDGRELGRANATWIALPTGA